MCAHMCLSLTSSLWVLLWWVWAEAEGTVVLGSQENAAVQHALPVEPFQPEDTPPGQEQERYSH